MFSAPLSPNNPGKVIFSQKVCFCDCCWCVSAVTIISGVLMLILFVSELQYYLTKEVSFCRFLSSPKTCFSTGKRFLRFGLTSSADSNLRLKKRSGSNDPQDELKYS